MNCPHAFLWSIVAEGAIDAVCGRPEGANPYHHAPDAAEAWSYGHAEGGWLLELRGQAETSRWLAETA